MKEEFAAAAANKATAASYGAAGSAFMIGGLTANEFAALVGAACAVLTMLINGYYRRREFNLRKDAEHK